MTCKNAAKNDYLLNIFMLKKQTIYFTENATLDFMKRSFKN